MSDYPQAKRRPRSHLAAAIWIALCAILTLLRGYLVPSLASPRSSGLQNCNGNFFPSGPIFPLHRPPDLLICRCSFSPRKFPAPPLTTRGPPDSEAISKVLP